MGVLDRLERVGAEGGKGEMDEPVLQVAALGVFLVQVHGVGEALPEGGVADACHCCLLRECLSFVI